VNAGSRTVGSILPITFGSVLSNVTRQAVVVLLTRGAAFLLGIASTILLSRLLGTAGLGQFRLGSVVAQLLSFFCLLGLDRGLLRYLPVLETQGGNGSRTLLARSSRVVIAISLALSVALLLGAPAVATYYFHSPGMTNVLRVFSLQVPVLVLLRFLSSAVTAAKRVDFASKITNILSPAIFLALLAPIGFVHPGLYGPIAARILAQLAAVLCLLLFLMRRYPKAPKVEPVADDIFRDYLRLSMPLFFIGIGYQLLNQMDTIMLGHFASARDVGIYSVALKVSSFVVIGLEIVLPIVAPLFSQFSETRDNELTEALFRTVTKWLCYSALIMFACIAIFRVELLHVFGKGFTAGATALLILAPGYLTSPATGPNGMLLTMTGKQKWELANTISLIVFNFLLNLVLIPTIGLIGAAIATAVSIAIINGLRLVQVYMLFGFQPYNLKYLKGVFAIGGAGLIGYLVRSWLSNVGYSPFMIILLGGIAFLVTAILGFLLVGLDYEDKMAIIALRRRQSDVSVLPAGKAAEQPLY
jgi:O-antigen/teichoic acid export membrane protein